MGIGVSLFLIALGAVLAFAVNVTSSAFNVQIVGYILLAVGGLGLLLSLLFWSSFAPFRRGPADTTVVREREVRDRDVI